MTSNIALNDFKFSKNMQKIGFYAISNYKDHVMSV